MSNLALVAFETLLQDHGVLVVRVDPDGTSTPDIPVLWEEERIERDFQPNAERTMRTGMLTVRTCDAPYAVGEQWIVEDLTWQVTATPHDERGLRLIELRRDDKVRTVSSRGHVL